MHDPTSSSPSAGLHRRQLLAAGAAGAAALAGLAAGAEGEAATSREHGEPLPVVYLPHGGGPWPFVDMGFGSKAELAEMASYLRGVATVPRTKPKALLVVSAHWEEKVATLMTSPRPPMLYDYYGFPPESYTITWPAPGAPQLAARVRALLSAAGIASAEDPNRGFDHGTFVPLKLAYPQAEIPTVQLSLIRGLDPAQHLAMGKALQALRKEGVFIIGSGMTYHNMRGFSDARSVPVSQQFDRWLQETMAQEPAERDRRLLRWAEAPAARAAHPREEHLIPLMVIAGAAGLDKAAVPYRGTLVGLQLSAYHFG